VENQQPLLTQPHVQYEGGPAQGASGGLYRPSCSESGAGARRKRFGALLLRPCI